MGMGGAFILAVREFVPEKATSVALFSPSEISNVVIPPTLLWLVVPHESEDGWSCSLPGST